MIKFIKKSLTKFIENKRYLYFLPKSIRMRLFNIKKLKLYKTKTGNYYLPRYAYKDIIRNCIINNTIFDEHIYHLGKKYIKENSIVLDLGSNFGQLGILFSKAQKNVDVYCFEASKYISEILKKNIQINNANAIPINCIVGNKTGEKLKIQSATLKNYNTYGSNKIEINKQKTNNNSEEIDLVKIDDFNFEKKISFMKIDIQGYDLMALKGSVKTIAKHKMPIVFEYTPEYSEELNYTFEDFERFIKSIDYYIVKKIDYYNYLIKPI
jgi:FkbM family methyltransferase